MRPAVAILLLASTLAAISASPRTVDASRSRAAFSVSHIWVERVTGTVPILSGSVTLGDGSMVPTAATAVLDATRIETGEPDRDRSLESPDFFDAARFPRWTFTSTKVIARSASVFDMDGNLTIHGVTQPEKLDVTASGTPAQPAYRATAQIDRHAFGMSVTRLDPTIGGTVTVTLNIVLQ